MSVTARSVPRRGFKKRATQWHRTCYNDSKECAMGLFEKYAGLPLGFRIFVVLLALLGVIAAYAAGC